MLAAPSEAGEVRGGQAKLFATAGISAYGGTEEIQFFKLMCIQPGYICLFPSLQDRKLPITTGLAV